MMFYKYYRYCRIYNRYEGSLDGIYWVCFSHGSYGSLYAKRQIERNKMGTYEGQFDDKIKSGYEQSQDEAQKQLENQKISIEYCTYNGKRCKLISKNYQTGDATIEAQDVTGPYTLSVRLADLNIENPKATDKCTCGNDSLSPSKQGKHADWCDKFYKY